MASASPGYGPPRLGRPAVLRRGPFRGPQRSEPHFVSLASGWPASAPGRRRSGRRPAPVRAGAAGRTGTPVRAPGPRTRGPRRSRPARRRLALPGDGVHAGDQGEHHPYRRVVGVRAQDEVGQAVGHPLLVGRGSRLPSSSTRTPWRSRSVPRSRRARPASSRARSARTSRRRGRPAGRAGRAPPSPAGRRPRRRRCGRPPGAGRPAARQRSDRAARGSTAASTSRRFAGVDTGPAISTMARACAGEMSPALRAARVAGRPSTSVTASISSREAARPETPRVAAASSTAHSLTSVSAAGRAARDPPTRRPAHPARGRTTPPAAAGEGGQGSERGRLARSCSPAATARRGAPPPTHSRARVSGPRCCSSRRSGPRRDIAPRAPPRNTR